MKYIVDKYQIFTIKNIIPLQAKIIIKNMTRL